MSDQFSSQLEAPIDRFLSLVLQFALNNDWLSPDDIVSEFPPRAIVEALETADDLRARILVELAGVHERIAPKKSTAAAAEDLELALSEGFWSADKLLSVLDVDAQVSHFDKQKLLSLATRDGFWNEGSPRSKDRLLHVLQTALDEDLLDVKKLVVAIGPDQVVAIFPKELLEKALADALRLGLEGKAFDPGQLLFNVPLPEWVEHVPPADLWEKVVVQEVLSAAGWTSAGSNGAPRKRPAAAAPAPVGSVAPPSERRRDEVAAREKALGNLRRIDREPKNAGQLSTPLLLALDALYAELGRISDDDERAEAIRDAFPNEKLLEEGLYALAVTLDPKLDEQELRAKSPTTDSLIQLVLFEERRRSNGGANRPSSPPPLAPLDNVVGPPPGLPPPPPSKRSVPPPPPRKAH